MTDPSPESIRIDDFNYVLPNDRIAQYPLPQRDQSNLLVYRDGEINHARFHQIGAFLPPQSTLIFNETKVIPARLFFRRQTGALIEVFLLDPVEDSGTIEQVLADRSGHTTWNCLVGNSKKWKSGEVISLVDEDGTTIFTASRTHDTPTVIQLEWTSGQPLSDVLTHAGKMPLPPYIDRSAEAEDESNYQTVYARNDGAVAAPTAGLHFTDDLLKSLEDNGHTTTKLTLHVGAGTFKPVDVEHPWQHPMHGEHYAVDRESLKSLRNARYRIATGTTSLRTLESLYWSAYKIRHNLPNPEYISQHFPYEVTADLSYETALDILIQYMEQNGLDSWNGQSAIMIMPGYTVRSIHGLITNFHLPKSTLLLLISAWIGVDWKRIYDEALNRSYRFLSYGDSSLLLRY
ncbi:MAG: S-adenosylmethionine:tRNA ribosyltransferase-isomerase [Bacteroidetes bacterium]|nr:S-adenosylmethionine:tRNA ribosyltransferase-isomerase [Bacteroidota bacterium]